MRYALWTALGFLLTASSSLTLAADPPSGEAIYKNMCANCHGAHGEGTTEHAPDPLFGDRSLKELTQYIEESMPEDDPAQCAGADAERVASYIYDAFYSPIAQARLKPIRIEMSRLTVRQYENTVADLVTSFRGNNRWQGPKGLKAEYFKTRRDRREDRVIERNDPVVDFDFGEGVPEEGTFDNKEEFAINWKGAVLAPETGDYDFVIYTDNGARLWVNDTETALIDAWVKSGDQTEYRGTIRLLGGRVYPLRLEYFKFKDKRASIRLAWRVPHHAEETIPARALTDDWFPETFVINTPFPPDDSSMGFERATTISKEWDEATTFAALEGAKYVSQNLSELSQSKRNDDDRDEKVRKFLDRFVEKALRRPLTDGDREFFVGRHFQDGVSVEEAAQRSVLLALKSPRFLYREFGQGDFDQYDMASWLSYSLWDSLPDQQLLDAAGKGQLADRDQLTNQCRRMLADMRTHSKVLEFLHHWLRVNQFPDIAKDRELYPEFDERVVSDLRSSLDLFLEDIVWSDGSSFEQLLQSDELFLNGRLAPFYGVELDARADFQKFPLPDQHRVGVLSHPYLMAGFGYDKTSSPIHRGIFLAKNVLGRFIKPPPIAVAPTAPDLASDVTTRERVALQTSPEVCQSCHQLINSLGFSLEHFDTLGRYRDQEGTKPIDATGHYFSTSGEQVVFNGSEELAKFLAASPEPQTAFVNQLFQALIKQPVQAFGLEEMPRLQQEFATNGGNIQSQVVEIAVSSALKARDVNNMHE